MSQTTNFSFISSCKFDPPIFFILRVQLFIKIGRLAVTGGLDTYSSVS